MISGTHLSSSQDRHATYLALKPDAIVQSPSGSLYGLGHDGEVVEALFDEETDDAVGVEEKIAAAGVLVPDDRVQSLELGCLWEGEDGGWQRGGRGLRGGGCFEDHGRCIKRRRGEGMKGEEGEEEG